MSVHELRVVIMPIIQRTYFLLFLVYYHHHSLNFTLTHS